MKGSSYEEMAASFFLQKMYTVLERNYRRKTGEIDLIVKDPESFAVVFVEVKFRKKNKNGAPEEAVNQKKQLRIYRTAEWYIQEKHLSPSGKYRFDVISILDGKLTHIKNAFGGF